MFGIGIWETLMIAVVLIIFIPPAKIPVIMRRLGTIYRELTQLTQKFTEAIESETEDDPCQPPDEPEK